MKFNFRDTLRFWFFVLVATLWVGVFFILPEFIDNPSSGFMGILLIGFHWGLVISATFFLLYALAVNKYVFAISFPIFSVIGSILAFFRVAYKATLTPMLIDASLHNDIGTTKDLISIQLILFIIISLTIAISFVWFRLKKIEIKGGLFHLTIAIVMLSLFFGVNDRLQSSILQRFPFSVYYNVTEYQKSRVNSSGHRVNPDPKLKDKSTDSLTVVLVLGESLRADHLRLNGYHRQTNPFLSKRNDIISFGKIYSEYTNTNRSLPHILTRADSANTDLAFTENSFIPLFKECGFTSAWISNQDPAETYVSFINECDTAIYAHPEKSVYNYNNWLDEDLLPYSRKLLSKNAHRNLLIFHAIGSHWFYNNHYSKPFELFRPVTKSRIVAQCTNEEIINSYDNTVVYTDYFLNQLIKQLEGKNALMIYISDHGEVLGEDGMWLHAGDHLASKNPACIVWYSLSYASKFPDKVKALYNNKDRHLRTDFVFHSILDAGNIPTQIIHPDLDIFKSP